MNLQESGAETPPPDSTGNPTQDPTTEAHVNGADEGGGVDLTFLQSPDPLANVNSAEFFRNGGSQLLTATLADAIRSRISLARLVVARDEGEHPLWHYKDGVWLPGGTTEAEHVGTRLLGERHRSAHVTNAMQALRAMPDLPTLSDEPPHPEIINFPNGVLRWADLAFNDQHSPDWRSTVQLAVPWDPDAVCPTYDRWVAETLPEDCYWFIDEVLGYCLMNGNPLHLAVLLKGTGRNGKGTFLRILAAVIGARNHASITLQQLASNRFAPAELHMKLANISGDIPGTRIQDTSYFKMITGQDAITAERKNQQPFTFTCWAVPVFSANKIPSSADTSVGYLSRWLVLPFPLDLTEHGIDPGIEKRIVLDELRGVTARAVHGLQRLMARGRFDWPASVQEAYDEFERAVDQVRYWVAERCTAKPGAWSPRTPLFTDYMLWAARTNTDPLPAARFYERLEQAGYPARTRQGERGFVNLALRDAVG